MAPEYNYPAWMNTFPALKGDTNESLNLFANAKEVRFEAGQQVFRAGDTCTRYLFCLSGRIRIQKLSPEGREIMLYRIDPGQDCALTAACLLSDTPYVADAIAEKAVRTMSISKASFTAGLARSQSFRSFIFASYGSQLINMMNLVKDVAFEPLDTRLADRLIRDADNNGLLKVTHLNLAIALGTVREVVTRELNKFKDKNWIILNRGEIRVIDKEAISDLAFK